jgi:hypothetical protein
MRVEMLVAMAGLVMQLQGESLSPAALVAAFDEQMQLRFLDSSRGVGIIRACDAKLHSSLSDWRHPLRRLPQPTNPTWSNPACGDKDWVSFQPRNPQEEWVDGEIKRTKVEVWTLLVGAAGRTLEGPVVAGGTTPQGMDDVRSQLLPRIAKTPISEGTLGPWRVSVKPVRASRESCMGCHTGDRKMLVRPPQIANLKLGDPLGYLVYLYR